VKYCQDPPKGLGGVVVSDIVAKTNHEYEISELETVFIEHFVLRYAKYNNSLSQHSYFDNI
jgi:hypothetical protein